MTIDAAHPNRPRDMRMGGPGGLEPWRSSRSDGFSDIRCFLNRRIDSETPPSASPACHLTCYSDYQLFSMSLTMFRASLPTASSLPSATVSPAGRT